MSGTEIEAVYIEFDHFLCQDPGWASNFPGQTGFVLEMLIFNTEARGARSRFLSGADLRVEGVYINKVQR